jgi:predicted PurR-regulated permease PerM
MKSSQHLKLHQQEEAPVLHPSRGTTALTIGIATVVLLFFYFVRNALIPFVFAGVIAFVVTPAIDRAAARTHLPRWIFALLTLLLVVGFFALIGWLGLPSLIGQLSGMGSNLEPSIASLLRELIGDGTINIFGDALNADTMAKNIVEGVAGLIGAHAFAVVSYSFASIIGLILSCPPGNRRSPEPGSGRRPCRARSARRTGRSRCATRAAQRGV